MNALKATQTGLVRALLDITASSHQPVEPARKWLSKTLDRDSACLVLQDYLASGEISKSDDPDVTFEPASGLWVVSILEDMP